jgi:hypothetical protein
MKVENGTPPKLGLLASLELGDGHFHHVLDQLEIGLLNFRMPITGRVAIPRGQARPDESPGDPRQTTKSSIRT